MTLGRTPHLNHTLSQNPPVELEFFDSAFKRISMNHPKLTICFQGRPTLSKPLYGLLCLRERLQQIVAGELVKSNKTEGLFDAGRKARQFAAHHLARRFQFEFVYLPEKFRCRRFGVLDEPDVGARGLRVATSLLPRRDKTCCKNGCSGKEGLCPGCPDLWLEARSFKEQRAIGRVSHSDPFELGSASWLAARRQASARAQS